MENSKLSLSDWDVADYLQTEEDIALFLEAVREHDSNDLAFMEQVTKEVARARRLNEKRAAPDAESPE
jgi:DNA-binding phage protein